MRLGSGLLLAMIFLGISGNVVGETAGKQTQAPYLLEFYGKECHWCDVMHERVAKLEKEEGVKVEKYEVWHNPENAKKMEQYNKRPNGGIYCGGVPYFVNTKTGNRVCGAMEYEDLKKWAGIENKK